MKITVKDLRIVQKGSLQGFCTVCFEESGLEFRDVRIIRQEGQRPFVVGPQREYEKDGAKKYVSLVFWPKESKLGEAISAAVLAAFERHERESPSRASGAGTDSYLPF